MHKHKGNQIMLRNITFILFLGFASSAHAGWADMLGDAAKGISPHADKAINVWNKETRRQEQEKKKQEALIEKNKEEAKRANAERERLAQEKDQRRIAELEAKLKKAEALAQKNKYTAQNVKPHT